MIYDGAGDLKSMVGSIPSLYSSPNTLNYSYAYDTLGRLNQEQIQPATNHGVSFDGTGYISANNTTLGDFGTSDFTISLWVKTTATTNGTLIAKRQYCNVGNFYRFVVSGGKLAGEVDNGDLASDRDFHGTATINDGAWHHLVIQRSGSTLQTFVDGNTTPDATLSLTVTGGTFTFTTPTAFTLGQETCNVPYTGQMDEMRIYNYAITPAQISALAASGPATNASQGCVAYWSFDETSGSNYVDGTGYSNFGVPTGGVTSTTGCPSNGYRSTYIYDGGAANGAGNPTFFAGISRTYNSNNQIVGVGYDNAGNPTTAQGNALSWDVENRLSSAGSQSFSYLPNGLRGTSTVGGATTYYLYDGDYPVEWFNSALTDLNDFEYGPNGLASGGSGALDNFVFDSLGNIISSAASGPPVQYKPQYPIDAWGTVGGASLPSQNYGFQHNPAYAFNSASGLIGMTYRFYDPTTGRFLNRDPIGYGGGLNLYGYADDDPVNGVDPSGLDVYMPPGPGASWSDWWNATVGLKFPLLMTESSSPVLDYFAKKRSLGSPSSNGATSWCNSTASSGKILPSIPLSGIIWSLGKPKSPLKNVFAHWNKHQGEFPEYNNALEYYNGAYDFLSDPPTDAVFGTRSNGDLIVYQPSTERFGVANSMGVPSTMFKPNPAVHGLPSNWEYFLQEIAR